MREAAVVASATVALQPIRARGLVLVLTVVARTLAISSEISTANVVALVRAVSRRNQRWVGFVRPGAWVAGTFPSVPERFAVAFRRRLGILLDGQHLPVATVQLVSGVLYTNAFEVGLHAIVKPGIVTFHVPLRQPVEVRYIWAKLRMMPHLVVEQTLEDVFRWGFPQPRNGSVPLM